jgi:hypothetical protein
MILIRTLSGGRPRRAALASLAGALVVCGFLAVGAGAAVPQNAGAAYSAPGALPTITTSNSTATCPVCGVYREDLLLTAGPGTWAGAPTSFAYQWQRCTTDGSKCVDISGATGTTYTLTSADVTHTVAVIATASNSDGSSKAESLPTPIVSSATGPVSVSGNWPSVSGTARIGWQLSIHPGPWTGSPSSYAYQWQRCDKTGNNCLNILGATGTDYDVKVADLGHRLGAIVTATGAGGSGSEVAINPGLVSKPTVKKKK